MAAIILQHRWQRPPSGPVGIDWSSPLTAGLVFDASAHLVTGAGIFNGVTGEFAPFAAGVARAVDDFGLVVSDVSNVSPTFGTPRGTDGLSAASWQLIGVGVVANATMFDRWTGTTGQRSWLIQANASATGLVWVAAEDGAGNRRRWDANTVISATTRNNLIAAWRGGADASLHVNGINKSSSLTVVNAVATTQTANGSSVLSVRGGAGGTRWTLARQWNRGLSDAESRALSENPWQIYRPLQRRIWVDMGGGTDTTTPQAQAAYTWAASASAPVIGIVAPVVQASYSWAASASPPVQATVAPAVSATYSWAAAAATPFVATTARPGSDISTTGWTATPGPSYFGMLDEPSADDADFITSPDLATPITMGLNTAWAAGTYTIRIRAKGASGQIRVVMLSQAGASVGASSYQAVSAAFVTYELPVTTTGVATAFRYELAA